MTKYYSEDEVEIMLAALVNPLSGAYGAMQCAVDRHTDLPVDYMKNHLLPMIKKPLNDFNVDMDEVIAKARRNALRGGR